jgi:hypothetical protein
VVGSGLPLWHVSMTMRTGTGEWFAEFIATFGLLLTILGYAGRTPAAVPYAVGLYTTAAYWFTASTSFANPAVTIARRHTLALRRQVYLRALSLSLLAPWRPSPWDNGVAAIPGDERLKAGQPLGVPPS